MTQQSPTLLFIAFLYRWFNDSLVLLCTFGDRPPQNSMVTSEVPVCARGSRPTDRPRQSRRYPVTGRNSQTRASHWLAHPNKALGIKVLVVPRAELPSNAGSGSMGNAAKAGCDERKRNPALGCVGKSMLSHGSLYLASTRQVACPPCVEYIFKFP